MRLAGPLAFNLLFTSPLWAADLSVLPTQSDKCSIFHALTGKIMAGCSAHLPKNQIIRSAEPEAQNGYVIHFDFDSGNLKPAEQEHLMRLSELLTGPLAELCVKLVGHTDTSGSAQYNQSLSLKRAQSVRLFLVGPGLLGTARVLSEGRGEEFPIAGLPGTDAQNRRVEVLAKQTPAGQCSG